MAYKNYKFIDLTYLYDMSDGDDQFIVEIIRIFTSQIPDELDKLNFAIERQEWSAVHHIVHKMKSSVNHVGVKSIIPVIQQIETCTQNLENLNSIKSLYLEIKTACLAAIEELDMEMELLGNR